MSLFPIPSSYKGPLRILIPHISLSQGQEPRQMKHATPRRSPLDLHHAIGQLIAIIGPGRTMRAQKRAGIVDRWMIGHGVSRNDLPWRPVLLESGSPLVPLKLEMVRPLRFQPEFTFCA